MGYYTEFDYGNNKREIVEAIDDINDYGSCGTGEVSGKWYNWPSHLEKVSKEFPDDLIVIEGIGEEYPDIWKAYFKNGKSYVEQAKITFEDFEESKLN